MIPTENRLPISTHIKSLIMIHAGLLVINAFAHQRIDLFYSMVPYMPLLTFFALAPLIAAMLLSTRIARQGAVVLLGMLPAILIYNIVSRFTAIPMFLNQEPSLTWKIIYEGSYGFMLISEAVSFWLILKLLQNIHRQTDSSVGDASKS